MRIIERQQLIMRFDGILRIDDDRVAIRMVEMNDSWSSACTRSSVGYMLLPHDSSARGKWSLGTEGLTDCPCFIRQTSDKPLLYAINMFNASSSACWPQCIPWYRLWLWLSDSYRLSTSMALWFHWGGGGMNHCHLWHESWGHPTLGATPHSTAPTMRWSHS